MHKQKMYHDIHTYHTAYEHEKLVVLVFFSNFCVIRASYKDSQTYFSFDQAHIQ